MKIGDTVRISVRAYMTKKATLSFDFMAKWNKDVPMPFRTMTGTIEKETAGMYYMNLHGEMWTEKLSTCMCCGRQLTNPVSQYFGIGPECGNHNYTNPFNSDEELKQAVAEYKKQLQNVTWEGWVIKKAITDYTVITESQTETKKENKSVNNIIKIDTAKKTNEEKALFISFDYNKEIVDVMRSLPFRYWLADSKQWEVPYSLLDEVKAKLTAYNFKIEGEVVEETEKEEVKVDFEFKTTPFQHQIDSFKYAMKKDRWLLGDEQGLGKTKQVIDIAVYKKLTKGYKHCLIICGVNGLKWNWVNEIKTHSNESSHILGQRINRGKTVIGSNKDKLSDLMTLPNSYFLITNVESLRDEKIAGRIKELCDSKEIGIVAIDEIHKCKNPSSQQGKGILKVQSDVRIAMTGTPLMNNPLDLYIILKWLGYENHAFYSFKKHYCEMGGYGGYEIIGYRYLDQLQAQLNSIMLRRLKDEVLDLPDKTYINEYVDMTAKQAVIYKEVTAEVQNNIDKIATAPNPLAELIRMRQATGYTGILSSDIQESAKLDRMEELVEEAIENNKKVVIFSNWTQITDVVKKRLNKYHCVVITGETKDEDRQKCVDAFQNDSECKVIIGTIGAMGTGLTLTSGTVEIFLDEPWNRALYDQAVDRCHRVGQNHNVTIYNIMCKNTIDERIHDIVTEKGAMSDAVVDGKVNMDRKELLSYLLS